MTNEKARKPELKVASGDGVPVKPEKDRKFVEALSRGWMCCGRSARAR